MPSTDVTKAPGLLDIETDQRDWFAEFSEESAFSEESPGREAASLFTVVEHNRPVPIILPEPPEPAQSTRTHAHARHGLLRRVKRAFSPTLAALLVVYVAVVLMTAWIGIERGALTRNAELTVQGSTAEPAESWGPTND
jgi:hypothetical protein